MKPIYKPLNLILVVFLWLASWPSAYAQSLTGEELLSKFYQKVNAISSLQYTTHNVDTFIDGHSREKRGEALMMRNSSNNEQFRFKLYGKDESGNVSVFDGDLVTNVYPQTKQFEVFTSTSYREFEGSAGGQLIPHELFLPETAFDPETTIGYNKLSAQESPNEYILTIYYPDNQLFGIQNRKKIIKINKKTWMPVSFYHRFDTPDGDKQVNISKLYDIRVNDPSASFPPAIDTTALVGYRELKIRKGKIPPYKQLLNTSFIDMELKNINGSTAKLSDKKGKVVLLDFWEIWCGPCIESMPKIKDFVNKYSPDEFEVWGVVLDEKTFTKVPSAAARIGINFPVYYGTEQTKKDYRVTGVPEYVIIDQAGKIVFISAGYSDEIEKTLDALLK